MSLSIEKLASTLCSALCADVSVSAAGENLWRVDTPFLFADGDPYLIYVKELPGGILRLTDMGHTLLHLSYDNEVAKFREGTRGRMLEMIKAETDVLEDNGAFYIDTPSKDLGSNLFRIAQALTKITDLTFLNRARAESTFYEDLYERLIRIAGAERIQKDYIVDALEFARDYPIDYYIRGKNAPLFVFGVPNKDKARLTTIILERLLRSNVDFDSLLVFSDVSTIPRPDFARLTNAGGEIIASLDAEEDLSRKILRKVG